MASKHYRQFQCLISTENWGTILSLKYNDGQAIVSHVSKKAREIKLRMQELEESNKQAFEQGTCPSGSNSERIRKGLPSSLASALASSLRQFGELRKKIEGEYRAEVRSRVYAVQGSYPGEEELDTIIATGHAEEIFKRQFQDMSRSK